MTVADLIQKLQMMPGNMSVHKSWDILDPDFGPGTEDAEVYQVDIMRVAYGFHKITGWKYKDVVVLD